MFIASIRGILNMISLVHVGSPAANIQHISRQTPERFQDSDILIGGQAFRFVVHVDAC
jgi:hypothetical protein